MININYLEENELKPYPFIKTPKEFPDNIIVDMILFSYSDESIYLTGVTVTDNGEFISCTFESETGLEFFHTYSTEKLDYIYDSEGNIMGLIAYGDKLSNIVLSGLKIEVEKCCIVQPLGIPHIKIDTGMGGNIIILSGDITISNHDGNLDINVKEHEQCGKGLVIEFNSQFSRDINKQLLPSYFPLGTGCEVEPLRSINDVSSENLQIEGRGLITVENQQNMITICTDISLDDICKKDVLDDIDEDGNIDIDEPEECEPCQ